jgi:hypothetical protein
MGRQALPRHQASSQEFCAIFGRTRPDAKEAINPVEKPKAGFSSLTGAKPKESGHPSRRRIDGSQGSSEEVHHHVDACAEQRPSRARQRHDKKGLINHDTTPQLARTTTTACPHTP